MNEPNKNIILEDFIEAMRGKYVAVDKNHKAIIFGDDALKVHEAGLKNPDYWVLIRITEVDNFLYHNC